MAIGFCKNEQDVKKIAEYLKYVSIHKEDNL